MDLAAHLRGRLALLAPGTAKFVVGVSGGADSLALLHGLVAAGYDVIVGHLDHALRPDSDGDALFVGHLAHELGVELRSERIEVASVAEERGWNLEDAARRLRYQFLTRTARELGAGAVLTAHTADDQVETVLMQLLRGAAYLRGMAAVSRRIVRPLLDVARSELEEYLRNRGQEWREDPTNRDTRLLRAWLRAEIVPRLRERYPSLTDGLGRHARIQRDVAAYLSEVAATLEREGGFDREALERAHPAVQREAIRRLFDEAGVAPSAGRIEEVRSHLEQRHPYRLTLAPEKTLRLAYGRLELVEPSSATEVLPEIVTSADQLPGGVPAAALDHPDLVLRKRQPGDRMRLRGGSKSLARLLMDRKIPREERDGLRVLASGSRVLWAEGIGTAADLSVRPESGAGTRPSGPGESDSYYMGLAIELAEEASRAGELPIGAVIVRDGKVIADAHNETEGSGDPTAHAEVLAMRRASRQLGDWRLTGCTLYVTLEPCPMCAGAMLVSHLDRVVYGAANRRDGALGSVADLRSAPFKRRLDARGGVLAADAAELLSRFFAQRRG